jgi:serine/threonine protein kinase
VVYEIKEISTNLKFVLKVIKCNSDAKYREALAEIRIQSTLHHPLVLKVLRPPTQIFEYYELELTRKHGPSPYEREVGMIMERGYCSLEHVINNPTYSYDLEDVRRFLAKFIALGVYLQGEKVVHRDIKPANVIIFGEHLEFKLADFGLACESAKRPKGFAGTLSYCSPWLRIYHQRGDNHANHMSEPFKDEVYSLAKTVDEALIKLEPGRFNCY